MENNNNNIKVSFDFDSTLSKASIQKYAKTLVLGGFDVWVVTSRFDDAHAPRIDWNWDLYEVAKDVGIPKDKIVFMNMKNKSEFFEGKDFLWHLDDDWIELDFIKDIKGCKTLGISCFGEPGWLKKCDKAITKKLKNLK